MIYSALSKAWVHFSDQYKWILTEASCTEGHFVHSKIKKGKTIRSKKNINKFIINKNISCIIIWKWNEIINIFQKWILKKEEDTIMAWIAFCKIIIQDMITVLD